MPAPSRVLAALDAGAGGAERWARAGRPARRRAGAGPDGVIGEASMCQIFAGQDPADYESETRSMRVSGHCTSIRLEAAFWRVLDEIAGAEGLSVPQFVSKLHDEVLERHGAARNFTSLLRCACLLHMAGRAAPQMREAAA